MQDEEGEEQDKVEFDVSDFSVCLKETTYKRPLPKTPYHYQYQILHTKYRISCPFERNILTGEEHYFIFPLTIGYILS